MKLLIDQDLWYRFVASKHEDEKIDEEAITANLDLVEKLKKYSCYVHRKITPEVVEFRVLAQKCTLEEFEMNALLTYLGELFDLRVEYYPLGGLGCGICLKITHAVAYCLDDPIPEEKTDGTIPR